MPFFGNQRCDPEVALGTSGDRAGQGLEWAGARFGLFSFQGAAVAALPVAVAIAVALLLANPDVLEVTGDEPHYLVMADSLIRDLTFDLRNSYARESIRRRIYRAPLNPHVVIVNHRYGPYHAPGLAILLALPFFSVA